MRRGCILRLCYVNFWLLLYISISFVLCSTRLCGARSHIVARSSSNPEKGAHGAAVDDWCFCPLLELLSLALWAKGIKINSHQVNCWYGVDNSCPSPDRPGTSRWLKTPTHENFLNIAKCDCVLPLWITTFHWKVAARFLMGANISHMTLNSPQIEAQYL
jgi:hypothetical protein